MSVVSAKIEHMNEGSVHQTGDSGCASTGDAWLDGVLDRAELAIDELAAADLSSLVRLDRPSAGLHAAGLRVERIRRKVQAFDTAYVTALQDGNEAGRNGCASAAAFLAVQLRLSPGEARARVKAAASCAVRTEFTAGTLPPKCAVLAAARAEGQLSAEHTAVIVDALAKLPDRAAPETVEAAEDRLVTEAGRLDPTAVARLGRRILDHIDPDGTLRDHDWQQRVRSAALIRNRDGSGTMRAHLTPEAMETWQTVLDPLAKPHPTGPDGPDRRTPAQRVHDALHDAGTRLLNGEDLPACGGTPATVVVHMTQEQYDARTGAPGLVETGHGNLLPLAAAFRLADQASVCSVITGAKGVPLQLGRASRIATPGQTIALAARDRGCTFPACDRPAAWTQRHHVKPWQDGGLTDLDNLALVCGYHHRSFEGQGWQCTMIDGRPWWIPPAWIDPRRRPIRNTHHDTDTTRAGP
jgi:Domain of unknown function (DUF222)/HNH endonuclease